MAAAREHEVVIVGAGIAGASLAYFLAERGVGDVVLLEREAQLAVHATGRSAATLSEFDAHPTLLDLKIRSAPFFHAPPPGFAAHPLLRATGVLCVYGSGFGARPEDGFFRVVFLAPPQELAGIYDAIADFTRQFLLEHAR